MNIGITLANFKLVGTITIVPTGLGQYQLSQSEALNIVSSGRDTTFEINFKITTGILKGPIALEQFKLAISFSISPAVTGARNKLSSNVGG